MSGLPESEYLRLRRRVDDGFREKTVVTSSERLFEIDRFRRMSGRGGTQMGEAVRDTYRRRVQRAGEETLFNTRIRDPRSPGGALGLTIPEPTGGGGGTMQLNLDPITRGPIARAHATATRPARELGAAIADIAQTLSGRRGPVTRQAVSDLARRTGERDLLLSPGELLEVSTAPFRQLIADEPIVTGNPAVEELTRPSTVAFAALPITAIGGKALPLGARVALEAGQGLIGRAAANAASERLEGQHPVVQGAGSLIAGLIAAGVFGGVTHRQLMGKKLPLGFSIEDVSEDPLRPAVTELKNVLDEELAFRVSGQADIQRTAGRARQFGSRREALEEASRRGLSGGEAEAFARSAMEGRLFEPRRTRISQDSMRSLMDGVHAAEVAGAIPNDVGVRLSTAIDKAANGIRLEPNELRLLAEYTGDRSVVDALVALNDTAAPSRAALNVRRPGGAPDLKDITASRTPATGRIPGRTAGGRVAEKSARDRARDVAKQAQEEARRIAQETARRRKNIPAPPSGLRPGQRIGGRVSVPSTGKETPDILVLARQARARAAKPVFGPRRPPTAWETFNDYINIPRTALSSFDLSAPFRQGAVLSARNPAEFWGNWAPMVRSFADDDYAQAFNASLRTGRMGALRERAGVFLADIGEGALTQREEAFMSRVAARLPGINASQNAYVSYLNGLRADVFDKNYVRLVESGMKGPELDKAAKELASFVNWATGRGNITGGELLNTLNALFFAPRLLKSRLDVMRSVLPKNLGGNIEDDLVRQIARENVFSWIGQNITALAMIRFATNTLADGQVVTVELDPRSSDFGKLRIGSARYDPWAGFQPIARLVATFSAGQRKTASGDVVEANRAESLLDFARTKTSPPLGAFIDLTTGETLIGEPSTARRVFLDTILPLSIQDAIEGFEESGWTGVIGSFPALVGFGVTQFSTVSDVRDTVSMELHGKPFDALESAELKRVVLADERVVEKSRSEQFGRNPFTEFSDDIRAEQAEADDRYREDLDYRQWKTTSDARKNQLIGARLTTFGDEPIEKPKDVYEQFLNVVREHKVSSSEFDWDKIDAWRAGLSPEENAYIDAQSGLRDTDFQFARRKVLRQMDDLGYFAIRDDVWRAISNDAGLPYPTFESFREDFIRQLSLAVQAEQGATETQAAIIATRIFEQAGVVKLWTDLSNALEQQWIEANPQVAADAVDLAALDWQRLRTSELGVVITR